MKTTRHAVLCLLLAFAVASVHATLPPGKSARWDTREMANRMLAEESVPPPSWTLGNATGSPRGSGMS